MPADNERTKTYRERLAEISTPEREVEEYSYGNWKSRRELRTERSNDERLIKQSIEELISALESVKGGDPLVQAEIEKRLETKLQGLASKHAFTDDEYAREKIGEKGNEISEKILEQLRSDAKARVESFDKISRNVVNLGGKLDGVVNGIATGNLQGTYNALATGVESLKEFSDTLDKAGFGEGVFAKGGKLMSAVGSVGKILAPIGGILAAAGVAGEAIDQYASLRQASLSQTGTASNLGITAGMNIEQQALGWSTGLKESDVKTIQDNLVRNRAKYGTQEYQQGLEFSVSATQQYGISAQSASNLYANAVLKGTMTVGQLNEALDALQETVKNTDITMEDAVKDFEETVAALSAVAGGSAAAQEWSAEYMSLFGNSEQGKYAGQMVSDVASHIGTEQFNAEVGRYQSEHPGTSFSEASRAVSMEFMGRTGGVIYGAGDSRERLYRVPLKDGKTFFDFVQEGDREALVDALEAVEYGTQTEMSIGIVRDALVKMGIDPAIANDNEKVADFFIGEKETGGQLGFYQNAQAVSSIIGGEKSPIASQEQVAGSQAVQRAVTSGYMTEEEAANLTEAQLKMLEEADIAGVSATLGYTAPWKAEEAEVRQILESSDAVALAESRRQEIYLSVEAKDDIADSFFFRLLGISSQRDADAGDDR